MEDFIQLVFPVRGETCPDSKKTRDHFTNGEKGAEIFATKSDEIQLLTCDEKWRSHASALVFQSAVTAACQKQSAIVIAKNRMAKLPPPMHRMPTLSPDTLPFLRFIYPKDSSELTHFVGALGSLDPTQHPDLLVLNDLDLFGGEDDERESTKVNRFTLILSLLHDLIRTRQQKMAKRNSDGTSEAKTDIRIVLSLCSSPMSFKPDFFSNPKLRLWQVNTLVLLPDEEEEEQDFKEKKVVQKFRVECARTKFGEAYAATGLINFCYDRARAQYFPLSVEEVEENLGSEV